MVSINIPETALLRPGRCLLETVSLQTFQEMMMSRHAPALTCRQSIPLQGGDELS